MNTSARSSRSTLPALAGFVVGIAVTLYAQFGMDALADSNDVYHWLQHGLLFGGGMIAGVSAAVAYLTAARRA